MVSKKEINSLFYMISRSNHTCIDVFWYWVKIFYPPWLCSWTENNWCQPHLGGWHFHGKWRLMRRSRLPRFQFWLVETLSFLDDRIQKMVSDLFLLSRVIFEESQLERKSIEKSEVSSAISKLLFFHESTSFLCEMWILSIWFYEQGQFQWHQDRQG